MTEDEIDKFYAKDSISFTTQLKFLPPDTYSIEIIEDLDRNNRWTTGSYDAKSQPEKVFKAVLEEVRANWEVDSEVQFSNKVKASAPVKSESPTDGKRQ